MLSPGATLPSTENGIAELRPGPPAIPADPPPSSVSSLLLQIPTVFLMTFLDALETGYGKYKNPYHNQIHAADVTQTVHCFLLRTGMVVGALEITLL